MKQKVISTEQLLADLLKVNREVIEYILDKGKLERDSQQFCSLYEHFFNTFKKFTLPFAKDKRAACPH